MSESKHGLPKSGLLSLKEDRAKKKSVNRGPETAYPGCKKPMTYVRGKKAVKPFRINGGEWLSIDREKRRGGGGGANLINTWKKRHKQK